MPAIVGIDPVALKPDDLDRAIERRRSDAHVKLQYDRMLQMQPGTTATEILRSMLARHFPIFHHGVGMIASGYLSHLFLQTPQQHVRLCIRQ
jgi:hypothetical protein